MTEVRFVGGSIVVVSLGKNENIVTATEGILEDGSRTEVDIGVMTRCLVGGRAVKVPDTEGANISDLLAHGLYNNDERDIRVSGGATLTVVFERRPPSPSIQTSMVRLDMTRERGRRMHTFSLDFLALGEGKVGSKEIVMIGKGHGE